MNDPSEPELALRPRSGEREVYNNLTDDQDRINAVPAHLGVNTTDTVGIGTVSDAATAPIYEWPALMHAAI